MNRRRWWVAALVVLIAVMVAIAVAPGSGIEVDAEPVTRGLLRETVNEEARTRVRDRYTVAAPITGRLSRVALREGDVVSVGDALATIYPVAMDPRTERVEQARLDAALAASDAVEAQTRSARAALDQARRDLARAEVLAADSIISGQELERLRLQVETGLGEFTALEAGLQRAQAEVTASRAALSAAGSGGAVVRAPADGTVLRVLEPSERVVPAGTPILTVGNAAGLEVIVDVLSVDAVRISPGDSVLLTGWGGEATLGGLVRLVEPDAFTKISALGVEEQRVFVVADLGDTPPGLGSGYAAQASIVTWSNPDAVRVPTSALFRVDGAWQTFVVENDRLVRRTVELGRRGEQSAEVLGGLEAGDIVVVYPAEELEDGTAVTVRER